MVKYADTMVTFSEVPNHIALCINITNCQNRCVGCHSPFLRDNIGNELTNEELDRLIKHNEGINCVCFMGEGNDREKLISLAKYIKEKYNFIKTAIYSGRNSVEEDIYNSFDFVKVGAYIEKYGPLNKKTTNQRLYKMNNGKKEDITYLFWNKI